MVLNDKLDLLKRRFKALGGFVSDESLNRLKDAFITSMTTIWNYYDFDFKNSTASISAVSGTKGPYNPPSDFVRLAKTFKIYHYKYSRERTKIEPIKDSEDPWNYYDLYYNVQDGKLYFFEDPGTATLTLNYVGEVDPDLDNLATTLLIWPEGIWPAMQLFIQAELYQDLPGYFQESLLIQQKAEKVLREYIDDITIDSNPKTINPNGINGYSVDGLCDQT